MCSTPPARTRSHAPSAISPAPDVTAVSAPAHMRSSAKPGTDCGMPASRATSRPSVRPWSPTCAVAAKITSPMRPGGSWGLRRRSSRTTLTAMSSARVFQKIPSGPARPNAVRTPSMNTTSRRSMRSSLCSSSFRFELFAEVLELPAVRGERLAAELDQHGAAGRDQPALAADVEQPAIRSESVAGRVHRLRGLVVVELVTLAFGEVRKVCHDDVHRHRHRTEQVPVENVHTVVDTVTLGVRACQLDCLLARVRRPDLDVRPIDGERAAHGSR